MQGLWKLTEGHEHFNNILFIGNMKIIDVVFRGTTLKQCDLAGGGWSMDLVQ